MAENKIIPLPRKGWGRFRKAFKERFFLRFHMTLILMGVFFSALIAGKGLVILGLESMMIRYPLLVLLSYAIFFLFIRLWLHYVRKLPGVHPSHSSGSTFDIFSSPGYVSGTPTGFSGPSGGQFSGGGAGGGWDETPVATGLVSSVSRSSSSGSSSLPDVDLDKGGLVLIALGLILALIFGIGIYLIYAAPNILSDAAVSALVASSLKKSSKTVDNPDWTGSVFKATRIPLVIILILSFTLAWIVGYYYPEAVTLRDVWER